MPYLDMPSDVAGTVARLRATYPLITLDQDTEDWVYVGDLAAGQRVAMRERSFWEQVDDTEDGTYVTVYLCDQEGDNEGCSPASEEDAKYYEREFGRATTFEDAWRYALGAMFGPDDDGYDDPHLRRLLITAIDPVPDLTDTKEVEAWLTR